MARKRKAVRPVTVSIKLTLDPKRDADLVTLIQSTPNKARLVMDALRGRRVETVQDAPADDLRDELADFLM